MAAKKINTAQALLAHIGLKTEPLPLFGTKILTKQWTASERLKYMALITDTEADDSDDLALVRPQAQIVAMSLVDDKNQPLFAFKWEDNKPIFEDSDGVESLVQNRAQESADAFIEISKFNGVLFTKQPNEDQEDTDVKK